MPEPQKFPLDWPAGVERSAGNAKSQLKTSLSGALNNVKKSLELFGKDTGISVERIVLSSNVGGLDVGKPDDVGVAAWFLWEGEYRCIAVDRYDKVEDNLQAIHHIIEARRTEMRHGGLNIVRQTFRSFTALPGPSSFRHWREVLELPRAARIGKDDVQAAYRKLSATCHPDRGGSVSEMAELNVARDEALKELGS